MNDAICQRCGDDHLGDYPVCALCAPITHFTHRQSLGRRCIHCDLLRERETSQLRKPQPTDTPRSGAIDI